MIHYLPKTLILLVICCFSIPVFSQKQYTSYDEFPGIIKSYKPAYSNDFPFWAKMLYQEPVNFNDITHVFDTYIAGHHGEENAIIRYFINWRRAVKSYALPDGTIVLPDLINITGTFSKHN